MTFRDTFDIGSAPFPIEDAVIRACKDDRRVGILEQTLNSTDNTGKLLGRLIVELHSSGLLDDNSVLNIVGKRRFELVLPT